MISSLCLNSCAVPRAAKQTLSSAIKLHKLPSFRPHKYCISRASASVSVSISDKKELRSTDLVALEYADLNLTDKISQELGHVAAPVPDWGEVFKDPALPLMVDIGSGSGRFLLWLAKQNPDSQNYLGLEIREKLVKRAEFWVKKLALSNIRFIFANASVSFRQLVSAYPGPLSLVSILCPDPHFKKRHHKRRVVQKPLVDSILTSLMPEGKVFIQSDVLEVAEDMRKQLDVESDVLQPIDMVDSSVLCDDKGWLLNNPMGIRTEREIHAEFEGAKIYRRLYQKKRVLD
ncbi:tRNA (guanine-N(7)-)-methyltransferase isoform X2 [Hibiscus syriacus]|uniref:tRNA (guanine-N(7)-)-methyltransferase isoform X2 n=1 Tax=Hibiscus syriacus TaxID=106335 RepID=UPI00192441F7|nr:tRNA (guanine-N(7)-)-methyltransferase isoform X2 [Hibiscus syriacus]